MSDIAIRVEGLGKQYRIGKRERYRALRDVLTDAMYAPFRRIRSTFQRAGVQPANSHDTFWALKDVSFEIKQGEAVGIIGRNGAGKSTLLKVLSRITEPTQGSVDLYGRVGSLLEVGTGFHAELTGRENIYLNGAILGMHRTEIARKFDEIVSFAEIEKFLDTPVKHYSSGMYVRLAFAVAAHLEPEILLVDEVLAVGDAAFQKKCLGKMGDVAKEGRTVLFVSHNMAAIQALCSRGVLLASGQLASQGSVHEAVSAYIQEGSPIDSGVDNEPILLTNKHRRFSSDLARVHWIQLCNGSSKAARTFNFGDTLRVRIGFAVDGDIRLAVGVVLKSITGEPITFFHSADFHGYMIQASGANNAVELVIPDLSLARGRYILDVGVGIPMVQYLDYVSDTCFFDVEVSDPGRTGYSFEQSAGLGSVYVNHHWEGLNRETHNYAC